MIPKIKAGFAIVDVEDGKEELDKLLRGSPAGTRVPVTLRGYLVDVWGNDDGTSQEFQMIIQSAETEAS